MRPRDTGNKGRIPVCMPAHADEKWRCAHFEQRARSCDSWRILRSTYTGIKSASQEARSICLGRSEPRRPSRLCGKNTLAVLRRSRPFKTIGVKRPARSRGAGAAQAPAKRAPTRRKGGIAGCVLLLLKKGILNLLSQGVKLCYTIGRSFMSCLLTRLKGYSPCGIIQIR